MRLRVRWIVAGLALCPAAGLLAQAKPAPAVGGQYQATQQQPEVKTITKVEPTAATRLTEAAPQPLGYETNIYCYGYLAPPHEVFPFTIVSAENVIQQNDFITGDLMYLDHGQDAGLKIGDEFWVVTEEEDVYHPTTGNYLGRFYRYRGRARTLSVEDRTATVRITASCGDIPIGATLKPFEPIPIPLARKTPPAVAGDPPSGKAMGHIIQSQDDLVAIGSDSVVLVDLGADVNLQPGDFLTIFRYSLGREFGIRPVGAAWVTKEPPPGVEVPRTYLGEIAVLFVGDRWAVGRVSDSYNLIEVGDQVEIK
jgi:hypothetical protein